FSATACRRRSPSTGSSSASPSRSKVASTSCVALLTWSLSRTFSFRDSYTASGPARFTETVGAKKLQAGGIRGGASSGRARDTASALRRRRPRGQMRPDVGREVGRVARGAGRGRDRAGLAQRLEGQRGVYDAVFVQQLVEVSVGQHAQVEGHAAHE